MSMRPAARFGLVTALLVLFTGAWWAGGAQNAVAGELESLSFPSAALGRPLKYTVYRPTHGDRAAQFPVLYLLHGAGGNERSWPTEGRIADIADAMIATGEIRPMLIVMPAAGDCWWVDAVRCPMETVFWAELEPRIAARSDVLPGRAARAIAGASAGGHGAIRLSLAHPDRFAAVAALSPAIYADSPPEHSKARTNAAFLDAAGRFDSGRWRAANYTAQLSTYAAARVRPPYYIVAGDRDQYDLADEAMHLHRRLLAIDGHASRLRILDGDHTWPFWARVVGDALRFISDALDPADASRPRPGGVADSSPLPVYGRR